MGEKLIGKPVVFDEVAYFTTFVPIEDPTLEDACDTGTSRIWAVNYNAKVGENSDDFDFNVKTDFTNPLNSSFGYFVEDDKKRLYKNYPGDVLSGVQVVREPQCDASGEEVFKLLVQKANKDVLPSGEGAPGVNAIDVVDEPLPKNASISVSQVRFDSWSIVFE